ncbi:MAG: dephospho-CoA kinase [Lachnospiraceae bacterium]|nr:dephospho-CoA kinase [Lachnospiraceae bacterium]
MRQNKGNVYLIGVTGGIGAGKSKLLSYIGEHYRCRICLADEAAHKVREPGQPAYAELVKLLGADVLDPEGRIDRGKMADRIFADQALLHNVNAIIHPAVKEYLAREIEDAGREPGTDFFFIEAALLIETGYREIVDELWYIHADREVREKRLQSGRGYTGEKIRRIMEQQLSEEAFRRECDFVVDNSGTLQDAYRQIDDRLRRITEAKICLPGAGGMEE